MKKSDFAYLILFFVLLLIMAKIHSIESSDYEWHKAMATEINVQKVCMAIKSRPTPPGFDDRELKSSAEKNFAFTNEIILKHAKRKPFWLTFTEEEIKAINLAKASTGGD